MIILIYNKTTHEPATFWTMTQYYTKQKNNKNTYK